VPRAARAEQDEFAATSQARAQSAISEGWFADEICAVSVPQGRGKEPLLFAQDEYPKAGTSAEKLGKLRAAFKKEGTVTAGNASGINDGAAAVLVASEEEAAKRGAPVLARIVGYASAGVDPRIMGMGPVPAVEACLAKAGWSLAEVDLIEANEAFAAQALGVSRELGLDPTKVNIHGGAIAVGHPIGASGCRVLVTLLHAMKRTGSKKGLATLCIGGGQGVAIAVEAP
jgi:acetyl-CoA C-acetyltransferase